MVERFRLREITVVADRGMASQATLEAFEGSVQARQNPKDPAPLKVNEVWMEARRYVVCRNEEERRKDAHDREAIVARLREQLRQGDKSSVGNKGYRRYLKIEGEGHFQIAEEQIKADALHPKWYLTIFMAWRSGTRSKNRKGRLTPKRTTDSTPGRPLSPT